MISSNTDGLDFKWHWGMRSFGGRWAGIGWWIIGAPTGLSWLQWMIGLILPLISIRMQLLSPTKVQIVYGPIQFDCQTFDRPVLLYQSITKSPILNLCVVIILSYRVFIFAREACKEQRSSSRVPLSLIPKPATNAELAVDCTLPWALKVFRWWCWKNIYRNFENFSKNRLCRSEPSTCTNTRYNCIHCWLNV